MANSSDQGAANKIPVLLLKTKSTPSDAYQEILSEGSHSCGNLRVQFDPSFVPVLLHRFEEAGVRRLRDLLRHRQIGSRTDCTYGGLIFTSQRAVEAFTEVAKEAQGTLIGTLSLHRMYLQCSGSLSY